MAINLDSSLKQEYVDLYKNCQIRSERLATVDTTINSLLSNKRRYKAVEKRSNVPWYFIAILHSLESSLNFNTHLHNGDSLTARTVQVPAGRPPMGNPPFSWEESAIDALESAKLTTWNNWSIEGNCYSFEKYNGWGYRMFHSEVKSPYLWSFSNQYTKGKYKSDGRFDPDLVSQQCGAIVLLKRMEERGIIPNISTSAVSINPFSQVTWLEVYRKEKGDDGSSLAVLAALNGSTVVHVVELENREVDDLVAFCGQYPNAKTFHVAASTKPVPATTELVISPSTSTLPPLDRILRWGHIGDDVKALQKVLNRLGFNPGAEDGEIGDQTEGAIKAFQFNQGLLVDGEVGPITWQKLGGEWKEGSIVINDNDPIPEKLAMFAANEAAKKLRWNGASSEAEKYLRPFRRIMQDLGHLGSEPVFYHWCAAFVTYCCRQVGIDIPDKPDEFWASMALVASWEYWAKQKGYWLLTSQTRPMRGDIITFDWPGVGGKFNHIGIVRGYRPGSSMVETAEGNAGFNNNQSGHFSRKLSDISGIIRIR